MGLLTAQSFLAQQAALAAITGDQTLTGIVNSQLGTRTAQGFQNDPYISYLTGQQQSAQQLDSLFQNQINQLVQQATGYANSYLPSLQIADTTPSNQIWDPTIQQNLHNALGNESNQFQNYLNNEKTDYTNYETQLQNLQQQNQQYLNQSNTTLEQRGVEATATAQSDAQAQAAKDLAAQEAQQQALQAKVNAQNAKTSQAAISNGNSSAAAPSQAQIQAQYPQSNQGTGSNFLQNNLAQNSNTIGASGTQSNKVQ